MKKWISMFSMIALLLMVAPVLAQEEEPATETDPVKAAKAQKKVAQAIAGVGQGNNAFQAIKNMEESVAREEAAAKAYETLSMDEDSDLAKEFEALEGDSVDEDLEQLKKELGK